MFKSLKSGFVEILIRSHKIEKNTMAKFVFFSVTILFVTCCLPGCMDTSEEEIKINEGMNVDELYYLYCKILLHGFS